MSGLLYPAYQKFYSALNNLERFNKEADFFDNISCLDGFFSEYRNITFVIQKALKGTDYYSVYEKNRDLYLTDHWFVEKRNETTKQAPFQLIKEVLVVAFTPTMGFPVLSESFSIESDTPIETLIGEIKEQFSKINEKEVFFSAIFSFHEKGSDVELLSKLQDGIAAMRKFMDSMDKEIGESCALCDELKTRIERVPILNAPIDFMQVIDYTYYPETRCFERAQRVLMLSLPGGNKTISRRPLSELTKQSVYKWDGTAFGSFAIMHAFIWHQSPEAELFPVIMVVYEDGTYDLDAFQSTTKTTIYRKINEAASSIVSEDVKEVCYMCIYSTVPLSTDALNMTSKERLNLSTSDVMVCASIDKDLNEKEYVFEWKKMEDPQYLVGIIKKGYSRELNMSRMNLLPIWLAFKRKAEEKEKGQNSND